MKIQSSKEIITDMANYVTKSGFIVETALTFSSNWVAIHEVSTEEDVFFIEYSEAEEFLREALAKSKEAGVDLKIAMLAQAKQYIDSI
jgi:hypothetical protein